MFPKALQENDIKLKYKNSNGFLSVTLKLGNKQCLFDTVMVNKEMMSKYLDYKNNCLCPIIAQS